MQVLGRHTPHLMYTRTREDLIQSRFALVASACPRETRSISKVASVPATIHSSHPTLAAARRAAATDTGATAGTHLSVDGLSVSYPDRRVLTDLSFTARPGDRLGLIGENGTGKSTLLRVLSGHQTSDEGRIEIPGSVALLEQELPYPDHTEIASVLDDAQREAVEVLGQLEALGSKLALHPEDPGIADAYASALESAERSGAWTAESARGDTLNGLGLGGLTESRTIGELSGGQRLRLALAAVLLRAPHLLLLDEPSNHLDDASAAYLERVLRAWPGIVIFASHDRALLDAVATKILDLDALPMSAHELAEDVGEDPGSGMGVRLWGVGYSAARAERAEEMRRWRERYAAEGEEQSALEHEIEVGSREVNRKHESKSESRITRKFYADKDAKVTARRARNARVRLETLDRDRLRRPPEPLRFRGFEVPSAATDFAETTAAPETTVPGPGAGSGPSIPFERTAGSVSLPARALLSARGIGIEHRLAETSLELREGEKLLLSGPNGAGKSTLLAILAGSLEPQRGIVERPARIGYLPQEVSFPEGSRSSSESYRRALGEQIADEIPLESIGLIAARDLDRPVEELSVGQRRRLALAILVADAPPVLLLDEPTNHLSLSLVEELEEALQRYPGALAIASHDRWLRSRWNGGVLRLGEGFE